MDVSVLSTQYIKVPVTATVGGSAFNPTVDTVELSLAQSGSAPSTWVTGSWETSGGNHYARILVGPASSFGALTAGVTYTVWIRITDNPEVPVVHAQDSVNAF